MVFYFRFGVLLLAATAFGKTPLIVGGQNTRIEKYPSLVQVEYLYSWTTFWDQQCAGSIVKVDWILSAAHCFDGWAYNPSYTRIRAGATYRHTAGSIHYVDFERNHPNWRINGYDADISVVKLRTAVVYSPTIQRATVVSRDFVIPDGFPVVHAGWGATQHNGQPSRILQDVTINVINRSLCAQRYGGTTITSNMICAGILNVGGKDACQGDSGGPLYADGIIVGIVSFGNGCADSFYPGVNTKVSVYTDWIVANTN